MKIVFIGSGNMAGSLMRGLCAKGHDPASMTAVDRNPPRLQALSADLGINMLLAEVAEASQPPLGELLGAADAVVLAVKPQGMEAVCRGISPRLPDKPPLLLSVAAGVRIASMQSWLRTQRQTDDGALPIVRCMPNTPALLGLGASGLFANKYVSEGQKRTAQAILDAVGVAVWLDSEEKLDAVTALSGSGPAYFFLFMEAMQEAAVGLGLDADTAGILTAQTARGATALASADSADGSDGTSGTGGDSLSSGADGNDNIGGGHLQRLRRQVTSPGGTTEAAVTRFMEGGLKPLVAEAMQAAHQRALNLAAADSMSI